MKIFNTSSKKGKPKSEDAILPNIPMDKLEMLLGKLEDLHGKRYSQLTYEEKKLVELSCQRVFVNAKGSAYNKNSKEKLHTLTYSPWFKWLVGMLYNAPIKSGTNTDQFYIIEDEPMIISNLEVTGSKPTQHPIADAIINWPNNQPVHLYKDVSETKLIANAWYDRNNKEYLYKSKSGFLKNEAAYKDAPVWLLDSSEEELPLNQFLLSLENIEEKTELGKIAFLLEAVEPVNAFVNRVKPDWEDFLGQKFSVASFPDAQYFMNSINLEPVKTKTKEEFLESCMKNNYTILEM